MKIAYKKQAEKYLKRVDTNTYKKLINAIEGLLELKGDIAPIKGSRLYRLKIDHYRVGFTYDTKDAIIIIEVILPRGEFYKHL